MSIFKEQAARLLAIILCAGAMAAPAAAVPVVYGFDDLDDYTPLTTQYAGLAFSQAAVVKAGFTLNESALPPRSADGVLLDDGGPITITFASPVFSVGAWFTYLNGLSFEAYDAGGLLLDSVSGAYLSNLADGSGDPGSLPNEFLQISSAAGLIASVSFTSDAAGYSFVLDDLTVDAGIAAVPEPSSAALLAAALCAALARRRPRRR